MADLRGQELRDSYDVVVTRGTGATPIEDGNGAPYFYEEGTWTPFWDASGGGSASYSSQSGDYVLIGDFAVCTLFISSNRGTLTGNISIGGLPFSMNGAGVRGLLRRFNSDMPNFTMLGNGIITKQSTNNNNIIQLQETDLSDTGTDQNRINAIIFGKI